MHHFAPRVQTCGSNRWESNFVKTNQRLGSCEEGAASETDLVCAMARPPGADDEYAELQKRFQMLENDRKNLYEHTQSEVKKNKDALAKLKKENKELRSAMATVFSDRGKGKIIPLRPGHIKIQQRRERL